MNQSQLDEIIDNHKLWLHSDGQQGEQANFSNAFLNNKYSIKPNDVLRLILHENGGVVATQGQHVDANGVPTDEETISHFNELSFIGADLRYAIFEDAVFYKCIMVEVDFTGANLSRSKFVSVNFNKSTFWMLPQPKPVLAGVWMIGCEFIHIKGLLQHLDFSGSNLSRTVFSYFNFASSIFSNATLCGTKFIQVTLTDSTFEHSDLDNSFFKTCDVSGCDFSLATMNKAIFNDMDISKVKFASVNYRARLLESIYCLRPKKHYCLGFRLVDVYGNARLQKELNDNAYIEDTSTNHPWLYKFWLWSSDCGRSMGLWAFWAIFTAFVFTCIYSSLGVCHFTIHDNLKALIEQGHSEFLIFSYYSVVTFTTLGFGDITPKTTMAMAFVVLEVILGFIMLGVLISLFTNKLGSR